MGSFSPLVGRDHISCHPCRLPHMGFAHSSVGKESTCNAGDPGFNSWVRKILWCRDRLPTPVFLGFPCGSAGKEFACSAGNLGSMPGWEDPLEKGKAKCSSVAQSYSTLCDPMDCSMPGLPVHQLPELAQSFHGNAYGRNRQILTQSCLGYIEG